MFPVTCGATNYEYQASVANSSSASGKAMP